MVEGRFDSKHVKHSLRVRLAVLHSGQGSEMGFGGDALLGNLQYAVASCVLVK
jgi:hypothetical protein